MRVQLDIYSGSPNPEWELSSEQAKELLELVQSLPRQPVVAPTQPGLGYRGFIVHGGEEAIAGYDELLVSGGTVTARRGASSQQFVDEGRAVERWLLETGRGRIGHELCRYVQSAIR